MSGICGSTSSVSAVHKVSVSMDGTDTADGPTLRSGAASANAIASPTATSRIATGRRGARSQWPVTSAASGSATPAERAVAANAAGGSVTSPYAIFKNREADSELHPPDQRPGKARAARSSASVGQRSGTPPLSALRLAAMTSTPSPSRSRSLQTPSEAEQESAAHRQMPHRSRAGRQAPTAAVAERRWRRSAQRRSAPARPGRRAPPPPRAVQDRLVTKVKRPRSPRSIIT